MHEIAERFLLSSGRSCTLYRIQRDLIPDYYLLTFRAGTASRRQPTWPRCWCEA